MRTRKLVAIRPHRYGTRHLTAGEEYEAPDRLAVALVAARRARYANKQQKIPEKAVVQIPPPDAEIQTIEQPVIKPQGRLHRRQTDN